MVITEVDQRQDYDDVSRVEMQGMLCVYIALIALSLIPP